MIVNIKHLFACYEKQQKKKYKFGQHKVLNPIIPLTEVYHILVCEELTTDFTRGGGGGHVSLGPVHHPRQSLSEKHR